MKRRSSVDTAPVRVQAETAEIQLRSHLHSKCDVNKPISTTELDSANGEILFPNIMATKNLAHSSTPPSICYFVLLNALICGIELSASAGFAYIPPLLSKTGLSKSATTCLMGIGPFLALTAIPILGHWSDHCQFRFGRRWPFILVVSLLLVLSLTLIPFGSYLGEVFGSKSFGILFTASGVILLDFSCLIGFNPCEALVSDAVQGSDSAKRGFMVYSCMLSVGGCIGYLITATDWSGTVLGKFFSNQEQMAFSVLIMFAILAAVTTMYAAKENLKKETEKKKEVKIIYSSIPDKYKQDLIDDCGYETGSNDSQNDDLVGDKSDRSLTTNHCVLQITNRSGLNCQLLPTLSKGTSVDYTLLDQSDKNEIVITGRHKITRIITPQYCFQKASAFLWKFITRVQWTWKILIAVPSHILMTPFHSIRKVFIVPVVLRRLFFADFCGWAALLCYYMFYTDYVAQAVFAGDPKASEGSMPRLMYDAGVRMGSWGLLLHSITACLYAGFFQDKIISYYGMELAYFFGLGSFGICMLGITMTTNITIVNAFTAIAGLGFAAITTIPNTLITGYHADKELYFFDAKKSIDMGSEQDFLERGIASDIAVIDSAYVLAQIMLSLVMGPLVDVTHNVIVYIVIATVFSFIACYGISRIIFTATAAKRLHDAKVHPSILS